MNAAGERTWFGGALFVLVVIAASAPLGHAQDADADALVADAIRHHQAAQRLRRRSVEAFDAGLLADARREYRAAAAGYRRLLALHPHHAAAYELRYDLADAYYWAEDYEAAADAYRAVRDDPGDDRFRSAAGRRVVESLLREIADAERHGQIGDDGGAARGQPANHGVRDTDDEVVQPDGPERGDTAVAMPRLVRDLVKARDLYLLLIPEPADVERVRAHYELDNARVLYLYGRWPDARRRMRRVFYGRCADPDGQDEAGAAFAVLHDMAVRRNDPDESEQLLLHGTRLGCLTLAP